MPATVLPLATRRINSGRGHTYLLDGEEADGVTWVLSEGVPKPALIGWAANVTRDYAVDNWDDLAEVGPAERIKRLSKARWQVTDAASKRGTEVHSLAHRLASGEDIDIPEELIGHVDSYLKFVADWAPKEKVVEIVVINRRFRYMGTLDVVAELADGQTWLLDWKTGGSGVYAENALQLAAYRNAETYLGADGIEHPMPKVDRCGVVWLRADGYDLYPAATGEETFRVFQYAQQVARWRQRQDPKSNTYEPNIGEALTA